MGTYTGIQEKTHSLPPGKRSSLSPVSRRHHLLIHYVPAAMVLVSGSTAEAAQKMGASLGGTDGLTVVNSVLGAYGLPSIASAKGFRPYDDFEEDYIFEFPKAWVARPNSTRPGITVSNFKTGDHASVEIVDLNAGDGTTSGSLSEDRIVEISTQYLVSPPGLTKSYNQVGPRLDKVKREAITLDGQQYLYMAFVSEVITNSGYDIRRKNIAVATTRNDRLYTLGVSIRADLFDQDNQQLAQYMVESFRLR